MEPFLILKLIISSGLLTSKHHPSLEKEGTFWDPHLWEEDASCSAECMPLRLSEKTVCLGGCKTDKTLSSVQSLSHVRLCDPMNHSTPGLPVHHQLLESTQTHVHWVGDAIQLSHPLSSPSPPTFNLSQHRGLFQWVSSLHCVVKVPEFQLQHQSFQWTPRTDLL